MKNKVENVTSSANGVPIHFDPTERTARIHQGRDDGQRRGLNKPECNPAS
jgi:hypothetical protein